MLHFNLAFTLSHDNHLCISHIFMEWTMKNLSGCSHLCILLFCFSALDQMTVQYSRCDITSDQKRVNQKMEHMKNIFLKPQYTFPSWRQWDQSDQIGIPSIDKLSGVALVRTFLLAKTMFSTNYFILTHYATQHVDCLMVLLMLVKLLTELSHLHT